MVMSEEVILSKIFLDSMSLDEPSVGSSRSRAGDCMVPEFLATADHQTWAVQRKSHTQRAMRDPGTASKDLSTDWH
jgi:hypothetical protein